MRIFLDIVRPSGGSTLHLTKGTNIMITIIAILALVSIPLALDVYFTRRDLESTEEEYVPDGR